MSRPLHIGILGHSTEGAALCFQIATREAARLTGPHRHPPITLTILPMADAMEAWAAHDLAAVRAILADEARTLASAGADFFVCPDNTAHEALAAPGPELALPGLHIAEVVAEHARTQGFGTLGVMGTRWLMEGPVYRDALQARGLQMRLPGPEARAHIHQVIFEELCLGRFLDSSRAGFSAIIETLRAEGCDAVVLGCTEIPLLIDQADACLPVLSSTGLLALAAVQTALAGKAPDWRGGPPRPGSGG